VFLEHNVYQPLGNRVDRFHDAVGNSACGVPLVLVDSGARFTCGNVDFEAVYPELVRQAMALPPLADIEAVYARDGNNVDVDVALTNRTGITLGYANWTTVNVMVYELARVVQTSRMVRAAAYSELPGDLPDGQTARTSVRLEDVPVTNWARAHVIVLADYRPEPMQARFWSLQASVAREAVSTATPTASATPAVTATPAPTFPPGSPRVFLPLALR